MPDLDQQPFQAQNFADNPEMRCPCVLLLDCSGSMLGESIEQLNEGLAAFKDELMADSLAAKRVQVAVIGFGSTVSVYSDFQDVTDFQVPRLSASGGTPMGLAIERALEMVEWQKRLYNQNGISYYRPWVFMVTDGEPTDSWQEAAAKVQEAEAGRKVTFMAVGTDGANFEMLGQISPRPPFKLRGLEFTTLFQWLSNSLSMVSASRKGEELNLPVAQCLTIST